MNRYVVTFDKSQKDIPTLVVAREASFVLGPGIDILSIHTGDEAVRLWNQLSGKETKKSIVFCKGTPERIKEQKDIINEAYLKANSIDAVRGLAYRNGHIRESEELDRARTMIFKLIDYIKKSEEAKDE